MKKLFIVLLLVIVTVLMVSCKSQTSPEIYITKSDGGSWSGEYSEITVDRVSSQVYIDENENPFVIIRGRIVNNGAKAWQDVCLFVELLTLDDDRLGGFAETDNIYLHKGSEKNFEIRIDNPAVGRYYLSYALSAKEVEKR